MPWIKATNKYPEGFQLTRVIGSNNKQPMMFAPHVISGMDGKTYRKEQVEYMDESEDNTPSFSIDDMKSAFLAGANWGDGTSSEKPKEYFKRIYNIDL